MATAFFGYVLPWGQMSFWGATVITNLFTAIPVVGTHIATWLWGDFAVGDATLNRFFSLHYLLPFIIAGVVGLHIWALHVPGNNNPLGIDVKSAAGHGALPSLLHGEGRLLPGPVRDPVRGLRLLCPELLRQSGQLPAGQSAGDARRTSCRNGTCLPFYAMLRSIPQQADGRDRDGGRHRDPGLHSLAGYQPGALLPLPPADEAVLLGLRGGLRGPGLLRLARAWTRRASAFRWSGWPASPRFIISPSSS